MDVRDLQRCIFEAPGPIRGLTRVPCHHHKSIAAIKSKRQQVAAAHLRIYAVLPLTTASVAPAISWLCGTTGRAESRSLVAAW